MRLLSIYITAVLWCCLIPVASAKVYLVGSEASYPPYEYLNADGQIVGLDVDLLTAAAKAEGMKIQFINTPWNNQNWVKTLNNGTRDIWASGIALKEDRKALITYTDPYYSTYTAVFVRTDNPKTKNIHTLAQLKGLKVATQKNTVDYKQAAQVLGVDNDDTACQEKSPELIGTLTQFLAFKDLLRGTVDAVTGNITVGQYLTRPFLVKSEIKLRTFNASAAGEKILLAFAVKKGNTLLAEKINRGLAAIRKNGEYKKIMEKWLGTDSP